MIPDDPQSILASWPAAVWPPEETGMHHGTGQAVSNPAVDLCQPSLHKHRTYIL